MEEALNKIATTINTLTEKHGEEAARTILETAQLMALNAVIQNIIGLIIAYCFLYIAYNRKVNGVDDMISIMIKGFGCLFGTVILIAAVTCLTNPILWKSLSEPKYYIAYQIMSKTK